MRRSSQVGAYEDAFSDWTGLRYAFVFWKGRVALYALLRALGVGKGDEVILPGYTCVMDVNPIIYLGARPVYVDIDPVTFNLNPDLLAGCISGRTRAIIAQHTYGYPADMDAILTVANLRSIPVIEDCCLSLGSRYKGRLTGTIGRAAYWSMQWNKPYTTGLGGAAATNHADLAARLREIGERDMVAPSRPEVMMLAGQLVVYRAFVYPRTTALAQTLFRRLTHSGLVVGSSSNAEFIPHMADDFFKGMSDMQARVGLRQLRRLDDSITHRRRMRHMYDQLLADAGWPVTELPNWMDPVLVRYPVRVADKERALATAASSFVELGSWFESPLHPKETLLDAYGYRVGMCPEAERACREVVNLPLHPRADERTARRTVEFVKRFGPPTHD